MRKSVALSVLPALMFGVAAAASAQQAPATAAVKDVQLVAPDGVKLKATYYAAAKPGPGILLLHMCNSTRQAWSRLASQAAARGYHVLAMDYRGYGESEGTRAANGPEQQTIVTEKWPGDVDAAFTWLTSQKDVDRQRIAAGGGSCGVNQSLLAARRHPEIKTVVLLSGGGTPAAREHVAKTPALPIFGAASHGDGGAVEGMRWLMQWSGNRDNKFLEYQAAGHGTDMFAVEKGLEPAILDWLDARLRTAPAAPLTSAAAAAPSRVREFWDVLARPDGESTARRMFEETRKQDPKYVLFPEGETECVRLPGAAERPESRHLAVQAERRRLPEVGQPARQPVGRLPRGRQAQGGAASRREGARNAAGRHQHRRRVPRQAQGERGAEDPRAEENEQPGRVKATPVTLPGHSDCNLRASCAKNWRNSMK